MMRFFFLAILAVSFPIIAAIPCNVNGDCVPFSTDPVCENPRCILGTCRFDDPECSVFQPCFNFGICIGCVCHYTAEGTSSPTTKPPPPTNPPKPPPTKSPTPKPPTPTPPTPTPPTPTPPTPTPPTPNPPNGNGGGDPHFKSWDGVRFNYHGECDLVMVHSDTFGNGLGLDVHIRTKLIWDLYTHIERAAVKIGDDVFEVTDDNYWFNGREGVGLASSSMSGFNISLHHAPPNTKQTNSYVIDLKGGARVVMGGFQKYLSVHVFGGHNGGLDDAVGLLGNKETGEFLGRDGVTSYSLQTINDFGNEWQVRGDEPLLFTDGKPLSECYIPSRSADANARKLRAEAPALTEAAEDACSVHFDHPDDVEACVFDVMVTGDFEFADAHGQMHHFAHGLDEI